MWLVQWGKFGNGAMYFREWMFPLTLPRVSVVLQVMKSMSWFDLLQFLIAKVFCRIISVPENRMKNRTRRESLKWDHQIFKTEFFNLEWPSLLGFGLIEAYFLLQKIKNRNWVVKDKIRWLSWNFTWAPVNSFIRSVHPYDIIFVYDF